MLNAINAQLPTGNISCAYRNNWPVTDKHRAACAELGHTTFIIAGVIQDECGMCGEWMDGKAAWDELFD